MEDFKEVNKALKVKWWKDIEQNGGGSSSACKELDWETEGPRFKYGSDQVFKMIH